MNKRAFATGNGDELREITPHGVIVYKWDDRQKRYVIGETFAPGNELTNVFTPADIFDGIVFATVALMQQNARAKQELTHQYDERDYFGAMHP
jgi:hypothetical protein